MDNRSAPPRGWAFFATAALIALALSLLVAAKVQLAGAATSPASAQSQSTDFSEAEGEEDGELEDEEEFEGEEDEELGTEGTLFFPPECLLHSAEAQVSASTNHDLLGLTIHYTATTPTNVTVGYELRGGKGSLKLGETKRHFAQRGVFRESEHLSERAMSKVRAAHTFIVQLDIATAPTYCDRYSTQRLTVKRTSGKRATWSRAN